MPQLRASIYELTHNPMYVMDNLEHEPVAIMVDDRTVFYCVNEREFVEFLAFKAQKQQPQTTPKKSIHAFAGIFKDKTKVKLSIDEMSEAIAKAGEKAGLQGVDSTI